MPDIKTIIDNDEVIPPGSDEDIKRRLERFIAGPPRNSRVFKITPAIAAWILDTYNRYNRSMKPRAIARFARHMGDSNWAITGDCLKFSDKALLRDGQNRLRACVRSGKPFSTHIVFGVSDNVFDLMDQGQTRSGTDVLTIAGYTNATVLSGAARHVRNLLSTSPGQRDSIDPDEALKLVREEYPTLPDYITGARAIRLVTGQPMTLVTGLLYVFALKNRAKQEDFATGWASGKHVGRHAAIGHMEKAIAQLRNAAMGRVHDQVRCVFIIIAWNLFVRGAKGSAKQFQWNPGDAFPEILG